VIQLTRLRHGEPLYLNPDLFERVDTHVDTVVRLTNGHEYVVAEDADEIARRVVEYRAQVLGLAVALQTTLTAGATASETVTVDVRVERSEADWSPPPELTTAPADEADPAGAER
jgi:uncharacterized protein YlzI (FlbEa/FlbD family)